MKSEALAEDVMTQTTELLSRFQSQRPSQSTPGQLGHTQSQSIKSKKLIMSDSGNNLRKRIYRCKTTSKVTWSWFALNELADICYVDVIWIAFQSACKWCPVCQDWLKKMTNIHL